VGSGPKGSHDAPASQGDVPAERLATVAPGSGQRRLADALEALLSQTAQILGDHMPAPLVQHYFRLVAPEDLVGLSAEQAANRPVPSHGLPPHRPQGRTVVRVNDLAGARTAVVHVVTDDMPFLVDSVTAELVRLSIDIRLVIHPQFLVSRDLAGSLLDLAVPSEAAQRDGWVPESWIAIEVESTHAGLTAPEIERQLHRVLSDVRDAVDDWQRMTRRAVALAEELSDLSTVNGADEAADLLRWLAADNFTFLGYREYDLAGDVGAEELSARPGTGLGILRSDPPAGSSTELTPQARRTSRDPVPLVLTKANRRSTVHRPAHLDYVGVKDFDENGRVIGERRFLGLYTSASYTQSIWSIPVLARKGQRVLDAVGLSRSSHSGKDLVDFLETYPRDEFFHVDVDELVPVAQAVLHLQERRQTRLFLRADRYGRFVSALVYLPRDRYTTDVRLAMESILQEAFQGATVDTTARVSESVLARLHFVVRLGRGSTLPDVDRDELEVRLAHCTRSWADDFADALVENAGEQAAPGLLRRWTHAFPASYRADFAADIGVEDALRFEALSEGDLAVHLYRPDEVGVTRRFAIYRRGPAMSLSEILPILQHLGVEVVDERPYRLSPDDGHPADGFGAECHIYDLGLRFDETAVPDKQTLKVRFEEAFVSAWSGRTANHHMNAVVTLVGLHVRQATILRAYARYLRQTSLSYSLGYIESTLIAHGDVTRLLIDLFECRFDPEKAYREQEEQRIVDLIDEALEAVPSIDADRILRAFLLLMRATLRTNAYQRINGRFKEYIALKLNALMLSELIPAPRPSFEVWLYSPQVEGVHLRFGHVARGGLRWSDRPDDFRTEVLGLVKAQMVKNAVIVPVGAKGGFVVQRPLDPADRDAWLAQGVECYRTFIRGLLDITDNLIDGDTIPPADVVRHDDDDSYLVVAADKGTATFSDHANAISQEYGFWLGDAFASGGSAGYDHKAMGITARGAWESVRRHFRELGLDTQSQDFTAVGIGDMSGDVFGNGMLLSQHIRLVAAFDHRHIFLDPSPDAAVGYQERQRLFALDRSSWNDYDTSAISEGGGVFDRNLKSIPISAQVRVALGLPDGLTTMSPADVMRAILCAPVDLLWNGGIGTYVKASLQSNAEVGDKANDAIRIDGAQLRARVVGEGGNLGFTQLGRVEAATAGVRINTDAIDNSAGVDTSDHEVNIKILLDLAVREGRVEASERNAILAGMTDEVAALVLRDNYDQNVVLATAGAQAADLLPVHRRMIRAWERNGRLDRQVEALPSEKELDARAAAGEGLTSPELAVLLAYSKIDLAEELLAVGLADDEVFLPVLTQYFPSPVVDKSGDLLWRHPLRREIITTSVVNRIINHGGISFVFRAGEETGADAADIARGFVCARTVFDLPNLQQRVESTDGLIPASAQAALRLETRRLLDRAARWFLSGGSQIDVASVINDVRPVVQELLPAVPELLQGPERDRWVRRRDELQALGAPADLAADCAILLHAFSLLDIVRIAQSRKVDAGDTAQIYYRLSARFDIDDILTRISSLPRSDRWDALSRAAMRYDLYEALRSLTMSVMDTTDAGSAAQARILMWEEANASIIDRAQQTLDEIKSHESNDLSTISVALRSLRALVP
jgi:glutamate dehydrogenase